MFPSILQMGRLRSRKQVCLVTIPMSGVTLPSGHRERPTGRGRELFARTDTFPILLALSSSFVDETMLVAESNLQDVPGWLAAWKLLTGPGWGALLPLLETNCASPSTPHGWESLPRSHLPHP